ncbi:MAG: serine/threonine protein kinase [Gammaproteobacteria bacterium]|nr:MAG: serine/threonine protein kinase [Gammaproteobacteria bacterium]
MARNPAKVRDGTLAYQDLTPDDIIASVESLELDCDGRLLALNSYENRVYRVGLENAPAVVAKFYRPGRWSDAAILEEHGFARELADADIPVVPPLAHAGRTLHLRGEFRFAVYPCHGGRAPELDDLALLEQLGRLVARIHRLGARCAFRHRMQIGLDSYGRASRDMLLAGGFIPEELRDTYAGVCELAFEGVRHSFHRAGTPRFLRLHGDFHPGNVLVLGEQVHIVDLDDTLSGPAVQDLWMFLSGSREEQTPQLARLLSGYSEFRDFDPLELHLVEALRTLRIMHYAAWLARRWEDPAFRIAFPWFNTRRYWDEHVLALREQVALMQEQPLEWKGC